MFKRLQDWQDRVGLDDEALGARVGLNRTTIMRAKRGLSVLRMEAQLAIQELTGITPAEWAAHFAETASLRASRKPKEPEDECEPVGALQ